jgi:carboxypeptidase Q
MLKEAGALALVDFDENGRDGTVFVDGFGGYKKGDQPALPEIVISKEAYLKFERLVEAGKSLAMELEIQTQLYKEDTKGYNLVAEIPGVDPLLKDEVVMLGGHMDSWQSATGATDNGAGCIVMMEAIRILKALGIQPKRTIRIALWGGEEQGLIGSFNYVKNHFGDPATMQLKPEQKKVSAYFNLDNGTGKIRGIYDQGNKAVIPVFSKWFEPFNDLGAATVTSHNTGATDHLSFDAVGIPGFQFIQDPIEYETRTHHSNMDTYDHLMLDDLKQAATIVAAFVYNTAMRSEKLPRKQLPKPEKFLFEEFLEF